MVRGRLRVCEGQLSSENGQPLDENGQPVDNCPSYAGMFQDDD